MTVQNKYLYGKSTCSIAALVRLHIGFDYLSLRPILAKPDKKQKEKNRVIEEVHNRGAGY